MAPFRPSTFGERPYCPLPHLRVSFLFSFSFLGDNNYTKQWRQGPRSSPQIGNFSGMSSPPTPFFFDAYVLLVFCRTELTATSVCTFCALKESLTAPSTPIKSRFFFLFSGGSFRSEFRCRFGRKLGKLRTLNVFTRCCSRRLFPIAYFLLLLCARLGAPVYALLSSLKFRALIAVSASDSVRLRARVIMGLSGRAWPC